MFPLDTIVSRAKRRGFVYPGSDIYGGLANAWDYGPYGIQLKKNIQDLWWKTFIQQRPDMIGLDAQILMHPKTWEASGHTANFDDPLIDDKNTGERFRADKIIEDKIQDAWYVVKDISWTYWITNLIPESRTFDQMKAFIVAEIPYNPNDKKQKKKAEWTDVRKFQMMFYTHQWVIHDEENKIWMRPETAQGIFVNFRNVLDTTRMRVPFGIWQVGKAFRNEITPGNFLYRTREFEQMEIEYFVEDNDESAAVHYKQWQEESMKFWLETLQLTEANLRFREHEVDELSHYSKGTFDVEFNYPWWWGELQGIAWRGNFDLTQHQTHSGKSMQYSDPFTGDRYIPQVIEPSFGLSRTVLAVMFDCYDEETYTDGNGNEQTRVVTRFPEAIAPVKYAILPLIKKDEEQVRIAKELYVRLAVTSNVEYDDGWAIGKRYRRQDEIGTPWCITVDHTSVEDGTVTLRHRDTMEQTRVTLAEIK